VPRRLGGEAISYSLLKLLGTLSQIPHRKRAKTPFFARFGP